jgi:hypothetical protein
MRQCAEQDNDKDVFIAVIAFYSRMQDIYKKPGSALCISSLDSTSAPVIVTSPTSLALLQYQQGVN